MTSEFRPLWGIDPDVTFLNHGSYGAVPLAVLEEQTRLRVEIEKEPLYFFNHRYESLLDASRVRLADFVGADPSDLVFIPNATAGVNSVLRSLEFGVGDEILTHSHVYNSCLNVIRYVSDTSGANVSIAELPFPVASSSEVVAAILDKVSPRTRLALLDHVASDSGLVFPLQELVSSLAELGIDTLVDGAHAPGMLPLNLQKLGATYYVGNCHKWLCAPKGVGFLVVKRGKASSIRPTVISHGANSPREDRSRFQLEFDWTGLMDPTPYLASHKAIDYMAGLVPGGWDQLFETNRERVIKARRILCESLSLEPPCPEEMLGAMATLPAPEYLTGRSHSEVRDELFDRFRIQLQLIPWPSGLMFRVSSQIYNSLDEYRYLADCLPKLARTSSPAW